MGLFKAFGGWLGAKKKAKAATKAADAQIASLDQGIGTVQTQQGQSQAALDAALQQFLPYTQAGAGAVGQQSALLGLNGAEAQTAALGAIENSPLLARLLATGSNTFLQNQSATGGLRGGDSVRGLADFGADTYADLVQQQLAQLGGLSEQGLRAAGLGAQTTLGGAELGSDVANTIASLLSGQGAARSGGIIAKANAKAEGLSSLMGGLGSLASAFLPTAGWGATARTLI